MNERLNCTTERFPRQSRDRRPFEEERGKSTLLDWLYGLLVAAVIGLALFALYYSRTMPS